MSKPKVVILASAGHTTEMLYAALLPHVEICHVFLEDRPSRFTTMKRRAKKVGWFNVLGQLAFLILCYPFIPKKKERIREILSEYKIKPSTLPSEKIASIPSVNTLSVLDQIAAHSPDLIVINGTRIIRKSILEKLSSPVVNIHVGITPAYRGIHGGYWALYEKKPEWFGVTLHYVDAGVDTGNIIAQAVISTASKDNFRTYPTLQYAAGIELLTKRITPIITDDSPSVPPLTSESQLHYHPTIWQYLFGPAK